MNTPVRIAILIIASNERKYKKLKSAQLKTWVPDFRGKADIFFVYGDGRIGLGESNVEKLWNVENENQRVFTKVKIQELVSSSQDSLIFKSVQGWDQILPNTISAFSYLVETAKYDFIIRTNLSTYWNAENTLKLIDTLSKHNTYCGPVRNRVIDYVEGDSMIFSVDVVRLILQNFQLLNTELIDDLAIAKALSELGVSPTNIPRPAITLEPTRLAFRFVNKNNSEPERVRFGIVNRIRNTPNLRCKDVHIWFGLEVRLDRILMKILKWSFLYTQRHVSGMK